jgi:carbonic anhydrase
VQLCACEEASILVSLENLRTFPWIKQRIDLGSLVIHGWCFDIQKGHMVAYNPNSGHFEPLQ